MPVSAVAAPIIGAAIGAGANLIGSSRDRRAQEEQFEEARHDQNVVNLQQQQNFETMLNETVQRRVRDARAAGIGPLAALSATSGAQLPNLSIVHRRGGTGSGLGAAGQAVA